MRWVRAGLGATLVVGIVAACSSFEAGPAGVADASKSDDAANGDADKTLGVCSGRPITSWKQPRRMTELVGDGGEKGFAHPFVMADGLMLWVDRFAGGKYEVFRAKRTSRNASFGVLERVAGLTQESVAPYPSAARAGEVLVMRAGVRADIAIREELADGGWSSAWIDQRPDNEAWPTISGDGTLAVVLHYEAEPPARFFDVMSVDRARVANGEAWSRLRGLVEEQPDGAPALPKGKRIATPALTPDALGLFFNIDTRVHFVGRPTRDAPFFTAATEPVPIQAVDAPMTAGTTTSVRSMTADGCELYLTSDRDGEDDVYVSERGP